MMMAGGAIVNALAFTGSSFLFSKLSKNDEERVRHDKAVEKMQKDQVEWSKKRQERIDFINNILIEQRKAETKFKEIDDAMREYSLYFKPLPPLPQKPKLEDYYTPSENQQYGELVFIAVSMGIIGFTIYEFERRRKKNKSTKNE